MTDRNSTNSDDAKRHLEESLASGRISPSEVDVIRSFFAAPALLEWPASGLQRRMQASGNPEDKT